jgi:hypothetical protein
MFGIETAMVRTPFQGASLDVTSPTAKAPDFAEPTSRLAFWRHIPQHEGRHSLATAARAILLDRSPVIGECPICRGELLATPRGFANANQTIF